MTPQRTKRISKFMSLVLRHQPGKVGIELDAAGWVDVAELLAGLQRGGLAVSREELDVVVATNDKQRFAFSEDGARIRASQGHSVDVRLEYEPSEPPEWLYHGTVARFLEPIAREGLLKGTRQHVHLSPDRATATQVGGRRGKPVILEIRAAAMHAAGHAFYLSANGVWLTDHVPAEFMVFPEGR